MFIACQVSLGIHDFPEIKNTFFAARFLVQRLHGLYSLNNMILIRLKVGLAKPAHLGKINVLCLLKFVMSCV